MLDEPKSFTPRVKRVVGLLLTIMLAALAIYAWRAEVENQGILVLLCVGIVLGVIYTVRGGSLPSWLRRFAEDKLTEDDDPRNISLKIYFPILLAAIVVAVLLYRHYIGAKR